MMSWFMCYPFFKVKREGIFENAFTLNVKKNNNKSGKKDHYGRI